MSIESIDKAMYDKERYESLVQRGISEDRAKRVGTVPLHRKPKKHWNSNTDTLQQPENIQPISH